MKFLEHAVEARNQTARLLKAGNPATGAAAATVRCTASGLVEAVDTSTGQQAFLLRLPTVSTYSVVEFLRQTKVMAVEPLVSIVMGLEDETQRSEALLVLADRLLQEGGAR